MEQYTLRLFFESERGRVVPFQDSLIYGFSGTHAINVAASEARRLGASHFNINLGAPEPVEERL